MVDADVKNAMNIICKNVVAMVTLLNCYMVTLIQKI